MMRILVSNDDGVNAEGINALAEVLAEVADVRVVAPDRDHSGASGSLTLSRPLQVSRLRNGYYCVDGTPADSVHIGVTALFDEEFDRVVSGINSHENLGDDVLYSGTVAAAIEGRFLKLPAIAVSLVNRDNHHYETAAQVVRELLLRQSILNVPPRTVLNVNVPDVPYEQLKGIKVTRLGHRAKGMPPQAMADPRGRQRFWISVAGEGDDAGPGTDFHAVAQGYVSITPLQVDMTRHGALSELELWLEGKQ
ncbi:MAG: 5'/3'-nucleotidase SurE [Oleiphilaceae bacterium]|nr:5'/3'-nucleotidase SurE [Oleiphilaceae bacterium]